MAHCGQRVFRIHKYTLNSCTVISVLSILCFTCCMSTEQHSYEWKLDDMVSNCRPWVSVQAKTDNGTDLHNITLTQSNSALFNNRVLIHTARSNFTARSRAPCLYQGSDLRTGESVYASELRGRLKMTFSYNGEWYRAVSLRNSSEPVVAKRFEIREDIFSTCHYKIPQESWSELKLGDLRVDSSPASSLVRRKRSLNLVSSHDVAVKKVMELALVIDRSFVNKTGSEDNAVARAMQLSNYANGVYQRLNLSLVLTNIIIWSSDVIDVTADPDETLNKFTVYKAMQAEFKHDTIVLMSNVKWNRTSSNVIGLAWIKGLCGRLFSSAIVSDAYSSVVNTEWVLAHEIGHNLGFLHVEDIIGCTCKNTGRCIMNAYAPAAYLQRVLDWSNCTVDEWRTQMSETWRSCLADAPDTSYQTSSSPLCGNGILETGEQCDCGPVETCKSQCCNASTCRLKEGATCASGPCCDWTNCSFRARGDVCRSASGPCDVPETCSGSSEWCPADDKLADGVDCASGQAFCYQGQCKTTDAQCQLIYSSSIATTGNDICFSIMNTRGDWFGHCEMNLTGVEKLSGNGFNRSYSFTACSSLNSKCGLLHCFQDPAPSLVGSTKVTFSSGIICYSKPGLDFSSSGLRSPGFVPDGAKCGTDSMCINSTCTPLSTVRSCPTCPNCNSNGVLTQSKLCFCNVGFEPPTCAVAGCGGSSTSPLSCSGQSTASTSEPAATATSLPTLTTSTPVATQTSFSPSPTQTPTSSSTMNPTPQRTHARSTPSVTPSVTLVVSALVVSLIAISTNAIINNHKKLSRNPRQAGTTLNPPPLYTMSLPPPPPPAQQLQAPWHKPLQFTPNRANLSYFPKGNIFNLQGKFDPSVPQPPPLTNGCPA